MLTGNKVQSLRTNIRKVRFGIVRVAYDNWCPAGYIELFLKSSSSLPFPLITS